MDEVAGETRNAADQLTVEQERASLALDAARMGEFAWEIAEDRMVVSARMAAITGLPAGAMPAEQGNAVYRYVHPDDVETLRRAVGEGLLKDGRYEVEYRMIRPDNGRTLWMSSAAAAPRDPDGTIRRVIGVVRDITARRFEDDSRNALVA